MAPGQSSSAEVVHVPSKIGKSELKNISESIERKRKRDKEIEDMKEAFRQQGISDEEEIEKQVQLAIRKKRYPNAKNPPSDKPKSKGGKKGELKKHLLPFQGEYVPEEWARADNRLSVRIGTTAEANFSVVGGINAYPLDSLTGEKIQHAAWAIPSYQLHKKTSKGQKADLHDTFGIFGSESTLLAYLLLVLGFPTDHVVVQWTAQYYGWTNIEKRFPLSSLLNIKKSVTESEFNGNRVPSRSKSIYNPSILLRSDKAIRRAFFLDSGDKTVDPENPDRRFLDLCATNFGEAMSEAERDIVFPSYSQYLNNRKLIAARKESRSHLTEGWKKYIEDYGLEAAEEFRASLMEKEKRERENKKRKREEDEEDDDMDDDHIDEQLKSLFGDQIKTDIASTLSKTRYEDGDETGSDNE